MTCSLHVAWDDRLISYDFGPGHPLAPVRVELTMALAREFGVLDAPGVVMAVPEPATPGQLELIHDRSYIGAVRLAEPDLSFGLGTPDNPVFPGMHEASALVAGATLAAAEAVWTGAAEHGVNVAGGLHHAMRARPAGSASTTTRPSRSAGCCGPAPSGSPTWTSTCTTATGSRPPSTTTPGCSRSACTSTR